MKVALLTNIVSPHQLPLAEEIVKLVGEDNYRYAYTEAFHEERAKMGWGDSRAPEWCRLVDECQDFLENADLVYSELRDFDLFERRLEKGKKTYYVSERWFKPIRLPLGLWVPGFIRLLYYRYFLMARRFVAILSSKEFLYLPQGVHAARDMARLYGLMHGDLRCLFRAPKLDFERRPGGRIYIREQGIGNREQDKKYCLDKMRMWGYFVEASRQSSVVSHQCQSQLATNDQQPTTTPPLTTNDYPLTTIKVLWVGRLLNWKRVDTIIRAVGDLVTHSSTHPLTHFQLSLDIYGVGPEEVRLKKLAAKYGDCIKFYPPVPIGAVRKLMREHDVYVLASNAYEGWGAVVSEALEEEMLVLGTYEAGSSMAMLPDSHIFRAGDRRRLAMLLTQASRHELKPTEIGMWTAKAAAKRMLELVE